MRLSPVFLAFSPKICRFYRFIAAFGRFTFVSARFVAFLGIAPYYPDFKRFSALHRRTSLISVVCRSFLRFSAPLRFFLLFPLSERFLRKSAQFRARLKTFPRKAALFGSLSGAPALHGFLTPFSPYLSGLSPFQPMFPLSSAFPPGPLSGCFSAL